MLCLDSLWTSRGSGLYMLNADISVECGDAEVDCNFPSFSLSRGLCR